MTNAGSTQLGLMGKIQRRAAMRKTDFAAVRLAPDGQRHNNGRLPQVCHGRLNAAACLAAEAGFSVAEPEAQFAGTWDRWLKLCTKLCTKIADRLRLSHSAAENINNNTSPTGRARQGKHIKIKQYQ
jgi:hypothetical protein